VDYWYWKDILINVACVLQQGGKVGYNATWVEKLQRGVARNLSVPHQFVCLSDCEVPCERIDLGYSGKGFWSKVQLFQPGLFLGPVMYLDLDTVICNSLDPIVEQICDQEFVMWHEADKNIHSSAFMWWREDHSWLWNLYQQQTPEYWAELYCAPPLYGDQAFVSERVAHTLLTDHCPSEWFHIASRRDIDNLSDVKMLMFRKTSQKPSTMLDHPLVQAHWV
jgi:hypothetical protein